MELELNSEEKAELDYQSVLIRDYLAKEVLPHVIRGLLKLSTEYSDISDPVQYLASYLQHVGQHLEKKAEALSFLVHKGSVTLCQALLDAEDEEYEDEL